MDSKAFFVDLARWDAALEELKSNPARSREFSRQAPAVWRVRVQDTQYEIPARWLRDGIEKLPQVTEKGRETRINDLRKRLLALKAEAEALAEAPQTPADAGERLKSILDRREFRGVRGPSPFELWVARVMQRIQEWLFRLLGRTFSNPQVGRIITWIVIIGSVILLAAIIFRSLRREASRVELELDDAPLPVRTWIEWLREAEAAAKGGDFRKAIRASYWAGVSRLEELGAWKQDRARTPREYLRLLQARDERRPPLHDLTRRFELTWYGYAEATPADYEQSLGHLEVLGCRHPSRPAIAKS
jgi:hypothetical protein